MLSSGSGGEAVACSADGNILIQSAGWVGPGPIWLSADSGVSWTNPLVTGNILAVSADGTRLVSAVNQYGGGGISTSVDSGKTWNRTDAPTTNWTSIACSADGNKLIATVGPKLPNGGGIYMAQSAAAPVLSISRAHTDLVLSWLIPSGDFGLMQSSSLSNPSWTDVPVMPSVNYTNLHYEVRLSPSDDGMFYRLALR